MAEAKQGEQWEVKRGKWEVKRGRWEVRVWRWWGKGGGRKVRGEKWSKARW